ncbi:MAG: YlbF family regulator [Eubacteriales bacterium]
MSIQAIAKSLANELIKTKEYHTMISKKKRLFSHAQLGVMIKKYEEDQFKIIQSNFLPQDKQGRLTQLNKKYHSLLNTSEMREYTFALGEFQKKIITTFNTLNQEIYKIVNG